MHKAEPYSTHAPVLWAQDSAGRPVSIFAMVMQLSTGQTSQQRLQPTHSASSTRGMRAGGVGPPMARRASALATGVTVMEGGAAGLSRWMHWCAPSQQAM